MIGAPYPKINGLWKRDTKGRVLEPREFSQPEFEYLLDCEWEWTEKVDGTNIRITYTCGTSPSDDRVEIGGRTDRAQIPPKLHERLADIGLSAPFHKVFDRLSWGETVTLYGEGYGAGIQSGGNYSPTPEFILFDVNVNGTWLARENVVGIAEGLGLDVVPYVGVRTLRQAIDWAREGFESRWPGVQAEGLVGQPRVRLFDARGNRVITKIKRRDFT